MNSQVTNGVSGSGSGSGSSHVDYTPNNILLTGGAGFIGSNVMLYLFNKYVNYKFVCIDKLDVCASVHNFDDIAQIKDRFTFVQGDICDGQLVVRTLQEYNIDTIMHFAAQTHVDNSFGDSLTFTESNVVGTHVLLEGVRGLGKQIKRFIHVSTDEVYGEQSASDDRQTTDVALAPTNPYAATKTAAEYLVKSYNISFKLPTIITRSNNVFGPRYATIFLYIIIIYYYTLYYTHELGHKQHMYYTLLYHTHTTNKLLIIIYTTTYMCVMCIV